MTILNANVEALATKLQNGSTAEGDTVGFQGDAFLSNLPDGLTPEVVNQVQTYQTDFQSAAALAFAHKGGELLEASKDFDVVRASLPMGDHATLTLGLTRPADGPAFSGELFVRYEVTNTIADVRSHLASLVNTAAAVDESSEIDG